MAYLSVLCDDAIFSTTQGDKTVMPFPVHITLSLAAARWRERIFMPRTAEATANRCYFLVQPVDTAVLLLLLLNA